MKIKACLWTMFAVCVGSLCHVSAQPSVDDYLARTADQYHFSQWGGRTRVSYTAPLSAWHLPVLSVPTNDMNVYVKVHSYTNSISAEAIARQIDADILRKSTANE